MDIEIHNNSKAVSAGIKAALLRGLEKVGLVAEGYAKKLCPVDTGNLRNSISHTVTDVNEQAAYVGSNTEYAAYVELGTGVFYPGGRQTPWVYTDAKGNTHMTHGQRVKPYIKPAVADHTPQYQKIIKSELEDK